MIVGFDSPDLLTALPRHLPRLRELLNCPSLYLEVQREWSSHAPRGIGPANSHRMAIRKKLTALTGIDLNDLSARPHSTEFNFSISHCPIAGGFALCRSHQHQIGFDLECSERIKVPVVQRISTASEWSTSPSAGHLWAAKEAAYKSLSAPHQPRVLSSIAIRDWRKIEEKLEGVDSIFSYQSNAVELAGSPAGKGLVFSSSNLFIAFFTLESSTKV